MKITKVLLLALASVTIITSCSSDDDTLPSVGSSYENGIIVSHEGTSFSGSTSFITYDLSEVENGIYNSVNGEELGVFQQSIGFYQDKAYIVVDTQNKITIVDRYSFVKQNEISTGLYNPRYIAFNGSKAYVTNWGDTGVDTDDFIAVVNLDTQEVESTIPVDLGPEHVIVENGKLYVSHKGAYSFNNIISVIDLDTETVLKEIETGYFPDELIVVGDELWVAVSGSEYQTNNWDLDPTDPNYLLLDVQPGNISVIDLTNDTISRTFDFDERTTVSQFAYDEDYIYYSVGSEVYELSINADALPTEPVASAPSIYGMSVKDNKIYTVSYSFTENGTLNVYDLDSSSWLPTLTVGLGPSKIYFN